jgi:hypothetical protein
VAIVLARRLGEQFEALKLARIGIFSVQIRSDRFKRSLWSKVCSFGAKAAKFAGDSAGIPGSCVLKFFFDFLFFHFSVPLLFSMIEKAIEKTEKRRQAEHWLNLKHLKSKIP